jgi:hypothetical protein
VDLFPGLGPRITKKAKAHHQIRLAMGFCNRFKKSSGHELSRASAMTRTTTGTAPAPDLTEKAHLTVQS